MILKEKDRSNISLLSLYGLQTDKLEFPQSDLVVGLNRLFWLFAMLYPQNEHTANNPKHHKKKRKKEKKNKKAKSLNSEVIEVNVHTIKHSTESFYIS